MRIIRDFAVFFADCLVFFYLFFFSMVASVLDFKLNKRRGE